MNGIPFQIRRDGAIETVYLSTRRTGTAGADLRKLKRAYHAAQQESVRHFKAVALAGQEAESAIKAEKWELLEGISRKQDEASVRAQDAAERAFEAATDLVGLALADCHGADGERIMDCLSDRQIHQCVAILETGDVPKDFFPESAIPPSGSSTRPTGAGGSGNSSIEDSPAPRSSEATLE